MKRSKKAKVEYCLQTYPYTRNCDAKLAAMVWFQYHQKELEEFQDMFNKGTPLHALMAAFSRDVISHKDIARIRADFNKEGKYLATDPEVMMQRRRYRKNLSSLNEVREHWNG